MPIASTALLLSLSAIGDPLQEPVAHVPAKWLVGAGLRFMNKLQPALQVRPYLDPI